MSAPMGRVRPSAVDRAPKAVRDYIKLLERDLAHERERLAGLPSQVAVDPHATQPSYLQDDVSIAFGLAGDVNGYGPLDRRITVRMDGGALRVHSLNSLLVVPLSSNTLALRDARRGDVVPNL